MKIIKNFSLSSGTFLCIHTHGFYFRVFGKGIAAKDLKKDNFMLFSMRNGYTPYIELFNWRFWLIK